MKPNSDQERGKEDSSDVNRVEELIDLSARRFASAVEDFDSYEQAYEYGRRAALASYLFPNFSEGFELKEDVLLNPFNWGTLAKHIQDLADGVGSKVSSSVRAHLRKFEDFHGRRNEYQSEMDLIDASEDGILAGWHLRSAYDTVAAHASLLRASKMDPRKAGKASGSKRRGSDRGGELKRVLCRAWDDYQKEERIPKKTDFLERWVTQRAKMEEYGLDWKPLKPQKGEDFVDEGIVLKGDRGFGISLETIRTSWLP